MHPHPKQIGLRRRLVLLAAVSAPVSSGQAAAAWAGISRMVFGESLTDAGPPR